MIKPTLKQQLFINIVELLLRILPHKYIPKQNANSFFIKVIKWIQLDSVETIVTVPSSLLKGTRFELRLKNVIDVSYWLGNYEHAIQSVLSQIFKSGMIVYDIGSYIGYYSLLFARLGASTVFSFEPDVHNRNCLKRNIELNNANSRIIIVPFAVGEKTGEQLFAGGCTGFSHLVPQDSATDTADAEAAQVYMNYIENRSEIQAMRDLVRASKVGVVRLDDFVYKQKHPAPDLIKIDVEGYEVMVLKGAEKILREKRPWVICEEHTGNPQQIGRIFAHNDYLLFELKGGISHFLACPREEKLPERLLRKQLNQIHVTV